MPLLALATFLAAALAFWLELLIARYLLPWLGGGSWVWTATMLFFQAALLLGYALAHGLARVGGRPQAAIHAALVVLAALFVDVVPTNPPGPGAAPFPAAMGLLASHAGLPFLVLIASAPLFTAWGAAARGRPPFWLYALSNLGAFAVLAAYPLGIEPRLPRGDQAELWTWLFRGWALLAVGAAVWRARVTDAAQDDEQDDADPANESGARAPLGLVLALPALGVALMLAVTSYLSGQVAPTPWLWAMPLAVYLLGYAVPFQHPLAYPRWIVLPALSVSLYWLAPTVYRVAAPELDLDFDQVALRHGVVLFLFCWALHGELYRLRPRGGSGTRFYLLAALGGVLGGLLLTLVLPYLLSVDIDLPLCLTSGGAVLALALWRDPRAGRGPAATVALGALGLGGYLFYWDGAYREGVVRSVRGPYGALQVYELDPQDANAHRLELVHGATGHGHQYVLEVNRNQPTAYFTLNSGVGLAMAARSIGRSKRVGLVGLGVGATLPYAGSQDTWRVYEIDPNVVLLAREEFSFLGAVPCPLELVLGDARVSLAQEDPHAFDVLVVDAFQGDTVPTHLLTREALALYLRHLAPDGLLALHLTSRTLDFRPLIETLASDANLLGVWVDREDGVDLRGRASSWALLTRDGRTLNQLLRVEGIEKLQPGTGPLWTDEHAPVAELMR